MLDMSILEHVAEAQDHFHHVYRSADVVKPSAIMKWTSRSDSEPEMMPSSPYRRVQTWTFVV